MNNTQSSHLDRAFRIASESSCRQKHGVVIAVGPRILAVAVNTDRNHPDVCSDPRVEASYHAEANAIRQLDGHDLKDATLYSARVGRTGKRMLAKPCERCESLIRDAGIRRYFHT